MECWTNVTFVYEIEITIEHKYRNHSGYLGHSSQTKRINLKEYLIEGLANVTFGYEIEITTEQK